VWNEALELGERYGYRNAQTTLLAPTGTIGLLMDCATTGVEPDFALVKFKKLAGGGYFKIVNEAVPMALKNLDYTEDQTQEILDYMKGTGNIINAPHINAVSLKESSVVVCRPELVGGNLKRIYIGIFLPEELALGQPLFVDGESSARRNIR